MLFTIEKAEAFGFIVLDGYSAYRGDGSFQKIRCAGTIDECQAWIKKEMEPAKPPINLGGQHMAQGMSGIGGLGGMASMGDGGQLANIAKYNKQ